MAGDFANQRSIQAWTTIAPEEGPRAAKSLYLRLLAKGWDVDILHAVTLHQPEFYAGAGKDHNAGDLKKPRHVQDHWALRGLLWHEGSSVARLLVTWDRERPIGDAKPKSPAWDCAHIWDIVTGFDFVNTSVADFEEWVSVFAPKPPPKTKAPPKPQASSLEAEIAGGVWHG